MAGIKHHDQWIKSLYRIWGNHFAKILSHSPIQANHLTVSRIIWISIASGLLHLDDYVYKVIAAICIVLFSFLDAADGELAKMTKTSMVGAWLDPQIDRLGFLILFCSVAVRLSLDPEGGPYWGIFTMATLLVFYFRSFIPEDINLLEKFSQLRVTSKPTRGGLGKTFDDQTGSLLSMVKLQLAPHTHNVALYIAIMLVMDELKIGVALLGVSIALWWIWENIKVLRRAREIDR